MATRITFEANGKPYTLELNAATLKRMEKAGFDFSNIGARVLTAAEELFINAFEMHHPTVRRDQRLELFRGMCNYGEEGEEENKAELADILFKMAAEAIDNIKPSGNLAWKVEK